MPKGKTEPFPSPEAVHPVRLSDGTTHQGTVFLKAALNHPRIEVGDYTYASTFDPTDDWASRIAPHLYGFSSERLVIGKFCQIAHGVVFITSSANHRYDGFSSFPFAIFDGGAMDKRPSMPGAGPDTIVGNDVWIGQDAKILPGASIGNGVIIGAGAVVGGTIPDYSIVAGNKAKVIRARFDGDTIARLRAIAWWDWPIEAILQCETEIAGHDIDALERACSRLNLD